MAILTISREYGSGGREIGRRVADQLSYQFVDKERLFQDLEKIGPRWVRVAKEVDEVCPTLWERHDWQYRGYVAQMEDLVLEYAVADNVVIIGRGGSFLLQGVPFCLRVRLVALGGAWSNYGRRADRAARRLMARMDGERACYIEANYGQLGCRTFDLMLNTEASLMTGCGDFDRALAAKDRLATAEAKANLALTVFGYRLKARIATDPRVLVPTLEVFPEGDTLVVSGIMHTPKEFHLLEEMAREVCGDHPVRFDLHRRA
jgi:shikimate kinase